MIHRNDIRIRDPFIYTDHEQECYYMYGTTELEPGSLAAGARFAVYRSKDLEYFEGPKVIFDGAKIGFWADRDFWAPEVHFYNGRFYLFGSCRSADQLRGTQIFVSDTPNGEFTPLTEQPITPREWECLDGTFWVEDGIPYIVFCHEWTQVGNGEIWAMPLTQDLKQAAGEHFLLFRASDHPCVSEHRGRAGVYVTDGPFLYREGERLCMTWSSFYQGRYLVLESESNSLRGEWKHGESKFSFDGGHAMIFQRLDGTRMISLHRPNIADEERPFFHEY